MALESVKWKENRICLDEMMICTCMRTLSCFQNTEGKMNSVQVLDLLNSW